MNFRLLILLFILFSPTFSYAQSGLSQHLRDYLEKLEKNVTKASSVGIFIADTTTGKEVFNYHGEELKVPASAQKILTTLAALRYLGGEYKFPTEVFLDQLPKDEDPRLDVSSGVGKSLEKVANSGNLYVRGYGDPSMLSEKLWQLASEISRLGVREINNLVIDDTLFVNPPNATGEKSYQAALSAVALDHNCYSVAVAPSGSGNTAFVTLTSGAGFELENRVKTLSVAESGLTITQSPMSETFNPKARAVKVGQFYTLGSEKVELTVQGHIGIKEEPIVYYRTVPNPAAYFGAVLRYMLIRSGVSVTGQLFRGETPASAKLFTTFESKPLSAILNDLNHYSSNFIAGQLVFAMGQDDKGFFRVEKGLERMGSLLEKLGEKKDAFKIKDGSGLDRDNQLSPQQLVKVLVEAYRDLSIAPDFISSFSRFGHTGTLKKRSLLNEEESRKAGLFSQEDKRKVDSVWAKTGTLDNVSSVAGYLETKTEKRFAFAIISNGIADNSLARSLEDDLVKALILYDK